MNIHEFLVTPADIARREGPHNKIVMSSRVRLARNVKGAAFPGWAKKAERIRILGRRGKSKDGAECDRECEPEHECVP